MRISGYGAIELKQYYQRNMAIGIIFAGLLVLLIMNSFLIQRLVTTPPSYQKSIALGMVGLELAVIFAGGIYLTRRFVVAYPLKKRVATMVAGVVLLIFAVVGGFVVYKIFAYQSELNAPVIHIRSVAELGAPPTITKIQKQALAVASPSVAPPKVGIPKAVPDDKAPQEQEFATQKDLSAIQSLSAQDLIGGGGESLAIDIPADEYLPRPDDFVPYDIAPKFVKKIVPKYPQLAKMSGVTGVVWVQVLVDKNGKVRGVKIYKDSGTNAGLEEEAIKAAKESEFTPAISNNQPIAVWIIYSYPFSLK